MTSFRCLFLFTAVLLLGACATVQPTGPAGTPAPGVLVSATPDPLAVPGLAERRAAITQVLAANPPVLRRPGLDPRAARAESLAIADPRVRSQLVDRAGAALLNEVFVARPAGPGDLPGELRATCTGGCYRVELYHYAVDATTVVVVALDPDRVVDVTTYPAMQPADVPKPLADLAVAIARADPQVQQALGTNPNTPPPVMANIKTALNATRCERAQHLCLAPTFHAGGRRALWVIVDLTDLRVAGLQFTELGSSGPPITLKAVEDSAIMARFCDQENEVSRDGWSFRYVITPSDGLRIADVRYRGQPLLRSASLVDWHVSYSGAHQFGYSDAIGCPLFSAAAVPAWEPPQVEPIPGGFVLAQRFRHPAWPHPCSYSYVQRYEFLNDGGFRALAISEGRGCGDEGVYRPVLRLALAGDVQTLARWDGQGWHAWADEQWAGQTGAPLDPGGAWARITWPDGRAYTLAPGQGGRPTARGDAAYLYATRWKSAEGESDLPTIGPCCNIDEQQGPEKFLTPAEPLANGPITLWYVPQLDNDATPGNEYCWANAVAQKGVFVPKVWPCQAGPLLSPVRSP